MGPQHRKNSPEDTHRLGAQGSLFSWNICVFMAPAYSVRWLKIWPQDTHMTPVLSWKTLRWSLKYLDQRNSWYSGACMSCPSTSWSPNLLHIWAIFTALQQALAKLGSCCKMVRQLFPQAKTTPRPPLDSKLMWNGHFFSPKMKKMLIADPCRWNICLIRNKTK